MNFRTLLLPALVATISITGCQTTSLDNNSSSTVDGIRQINNVKWDKTGGDFDVPDDSILKNNQSRIVVFQPSDINDSHVNSEILQENNDFTRSVVVGINDQFQVSLQPGQYSEVVTCTGQTNLSTEFTGNKNNRLANQGFSVALQPKQTYYYQVIVDSDGRAPSIQPVEENAAIKLLNRTVHQTHQISRIKADQCLSHTQSKPFVNQQLTASSNLQVNTPVSLDILFDFDSARIKADSHHKLKSLADFMTQNPSVTVVLESHTDGKGAANYNLKLSQARADSVKDSLVRNYGIRQNRITTQGYGESQPVATNDTEIGRQKNRRVVAIITP